MSANENLRIACEMYDNFNNNNIERSLKYISPGIVLTNIPMNMTVNGIEGFKQAMNLWKKPFSDAKATIIHRTANDDYVITEFTGTGTHDGVLESPMGNIPPTGKNINILFCEVMKIENGKAVNSRLYFDTASIMQQLFTQLV